MNIWSTIGIASIISLTISFLFDMIKGRYSLRFERIMLEKESRYRSILVFMSVILDESNFKHISSEYKPSKETDIVSYYIEEVRLHVMFSRIYASSGVIKSIETFLDKPNKSNFLIVANEMRTDLWGKKRIR